MLNLRSGVAASAIALATLAAPAMAQPGQPGAGATTNGFADTEIVVTAQRREERQVDVPISITALSEQQLATANVQQLTDVSKITPSLRFDSQAGFFQPSIRGIGTGITTSGGGSNVGIYVDGFYSPNPLAVAFELTKLESIQVLKGPQGTLFGRNTTGGAILVTTADPSEELGAEFKASYGRFDAQRYQAYVTTGLTEGIAVDLEGLYRKGDGFVRNILTGSKRDGRYENWTVRAGLKVDISENVSALFRYTHSETDDPTAMLTNSNTDVTIDPTTGVPFGIQTYQIPGTFTTNPDEYAAHIPVFLRNKTDIAQLTIKADLGFANLTSYSQYRREDVDQSQNLDNSGAPVFQLGLPIDNESWSQELLLTSNPGTPLQWTAGLFAFSNRDTYVTFIDNFIQTTGRIRLGGSSTTTQSYAAFVDATYEIMPELFLTAGARYSHDIVKDAYWNPRFSSVKNFVPNLTGDRVTPRVVLRYKPTDRSSVYASYTKGYKAAIIDVGGSCQNTPFICRPVAPETVDAFEVGFKYGQRGFSFELAGFYYDYKNLQVSIFRSAAAEIVNAAKSEIYGLEGQFRYSPVERFELNMGASYTHARYKKFGDFVDKDGNLSGAPIYARCPTPPPTGRYSAECRGGEQFYVNLDTTLTGVRMQRIPDFTGNIGMSYTAPLGNAGKLQLSGNLYYTSGFYFSPSGTQFRQNGYEVLSLRAAWTDQSERFTVAVFGDNVTDRRYRTQVQYNNFGIGSTWNSPATYGIEVGAKF